MFTPSEFPYISYALDKSSDTPSEFRVYCIIYAFHESFDETFTSLST